MSVLSLKAASSNVIPDSGYELCLIDHPCIRTSQGAHTEGEERCCPRFTPRLLARWFPPFFEASRPSPTLPPLTGKRTAGSCGLSTKMNVHVSRYAGIRRVPSDWEPPRFCLECRCRACANPRVALLAAFSHHPSRCYPLSYRPPLLCLFCANGTSRVRRIMFIFSCTF